MRNAAIVVLLLLVALVPLPGLALKVHIQGDRLSIEARGDKLTDVLERFAHAGIDVQIDPSIQATVSGRLDDERMEKAMDTLLKHYSYVLIWDVIEGPLGSLPHLSEIQIYKPERRRKEALRSFKEPDGDLKVTRMPGGGPLYVEDEVLLSVKRGADVGEFKRLLKQIGGTIVSSIPHLGIYRVRLPPGTNVAALLQLLRQKDQIAVVEPNYAVKHPRPWATEGAAEEAGAVHPRLSSKAPPIAILDSGLRSVDGLGDFVVGELDALHPTRSLGDATGHGTQMAMIASGSVLPYGASSAGEGEGMPIVAIRAFDNNGYASNFGLMRSIDYALSKGARVINMSWGTETDSAFLARAIAYAQSKGVIVVASAGNEPVGKPMYPAAYQGVVGVTAVDPSGLLWDRSNYGDFTYVAAPGKASFPIGHNGPPGSYAGTSIASAYVARALNLYLTRNPDASRTDALAALRRSVTDSGAAGKDPYFGHGTLDAKALNRLLSPP